MRKPDKLQHVAVVCVHGINMSQMDYFDPFIERVRKKLPRTHRTYLTFRNVFWADIVRGRQKDYIRHAEAMSGLKSSRARRFVIEGLGDAAAYQKTRLQGSAYYLIQAEIARVLKELDGETQEARPLVFIGHSLGCHIVSSYIWDLNKLKHRAHEGVREDEDEFSRKLDPLKDYSPFRRLETLAGFITLGSNMPLFTFTFGPQRVYPITHTADAAIKPAFPGQALKGKALTAARWLNFYSDRDVLGYPLKPLNDTYASEQRITDIRVRSEGWSIPPWNTIRAHTGYRDNATVIRETARLLQDMIEAVGDVDQPAPQPGARAAASAPASPPQITASADAGARASMLSQLSIRRKAPAGGETAAPVQPLPASTAAPLPPSPPPPSHLPPPPPAPGAAAAPAVISPSYPGAVAQVAPAMAVTPPAQPIAAAIQAAQPLAATPATANGSAPVPLPAQPVHAPPPLT